MSAKPWRTTDELVEDIKRKISFPLSQSTFTSSELIQFLNEEMMISQVPSVLEYHQEYYVTYTTIPLIVNQSRYPVPSRAIGMKLRDLAWADAVGNLFEMTRVSSEDKAFFQRNVGANQAIHKFYVEGNDIVLTPLPIGDITGSLIPYFYMRPNQLVENSRAATVTFFRTMLSVDNTTLVPGDTFSIGGETFTAVAGAPSTNEFQIGGTSIATATNLTVALNTNTIVSATNGNPSTADMELSYRDKTFVATTSNPLAFIISPQRHVGVDQIPAHFTDGMLVDFLQTQGGHKIISYDVTIPNGGITTNCIGFDASDFPSDLNIGDYICSAFECIIPFLPDDLHTALSEKASARILAAIGDKDGFALAMGKIQENNQQQGTILQDRVEGAPQKVLARHSVLRMQKMGVTRRTG